MMTTTRLVRAWAALMLLTGLSMLAASDGGAPLGLGGVAGVLLVAGFKSRQILLDYLGLRGADAGWRGLFWGYLMVVGAVILGAYAAATGG